MTKKTRSAKSALISAVLALAMTLSCFVGTTFAWFTDSVTSANNIIQSGNLDVELYYMAEGDSDWTKVDATTNIFGTALWEPGHTEVVKLKVVNEGSLALKYQLGVNVTDEVSSTNVNGAAFSLSDYIMFGIVDGASDYTRDTAIAAVSASATELKNAYSSDVTALEAKNDGDTDEKIVTLVVYMPTSVGNEANPAKGAATPSINLGINLIATQAEAEFDSFDNTYDNGAILPTINVGKKEANEVLDLGKDTEDVGVKVPAGAPAGNYTLNVSNKSVTTDAETGKTTVSYDIDLLKDNVKVQADANGEIKYEVSIYVGTMLSIDKVLHNNREVTDYTYDAFNTGNVTFLTSSFSPFSVDYKVADILGVSSESDLKSAFAYGGNYKLMSNVTLSETAVVPVGKAVALDLNGFNITMTEELVSSAYAINNLGTLLIKDSASAGSISSRGIYNGYVENGDSISDAKLVIESGTFNAMGTNGGAAVFNYGDLEIKGGSFASNGGYGLNNRPEGKITFSGASVRGGIYNLSQLTVNSGSVYQHISGRHAIYNESGSVVINGGSFDSISGNELILADGLNASVIINDGQFDKTGKSWLFGAATGKNITFAINGGVFNGYVNLPEGSVDTIRPYGDKFDITGGTFNFNPTAWVVEGYVVTDNENGTWTVAMPTVSTTEEFDEAIKTGGLIGLNGKITVDELGEFDFSTFGKTGISAAATIVGNGNVISRDTASGSALVISTTEPVVFDNVAFESVKGNAVLETRTVGANVTVKNSTFRTLADPSTGNTGVQVFANNATFVFENCKFYNAPVITNSSYPEGIKLEFVNCEFYWDGPNCPSMIRIANGVQVDLDLTDCKFVYNAPITSTSVNEFISVGYNDDNTTIDFNNFEMIGTAMEGKTWSIVDSNGNKASVNAAGNNSYSFNGAQVDFASYLFK